MNWIRTKFVQRMHKEVTINLCKKFIKDSVGRQLFRVMQETPEFEAYLPVSRLESEISLIIERLSLLVRVDFYNDKISNILSCLS